MVRIDWDKLFDLYIEDWIGVFVLFVVFVGFEVFVVLL